MSFYDRFKAFKNDDSAVEEMKPLNSSKEEELTVTADNIPLSFAKHYLRVDHDLDDLEIQIHLNSAKSYVKTFIKQPDDEPMDDGLIAPILAVTAYFYENKSPQMKSTDKLDATFSTILNLHRRDIL